LNRESSNAAQHEQDNKEHDPATDAAQQVNFSFPMKLGQDRMHVHIFESGLDT
jgi:hypothetical protein